MHLTLNAQINAAALTFGFCHDIDEAFIDPAWPDGMVELYAALAQLATLASDLEARIAVFCQANKLTFPGVYAYDVCETTGQRMANEIHGKTYTPDDMGRALRDAAFQYVAINCSLTPDQHQRLQTILKA